MGVLLVVIDEKHRETDLDPRSFVRIDSAKALDFGPLSPENIVAHRRDALHRVRQFPGMCPRPKRVH
jgi:hypothetical protein